MKICASLDSYDEKDRVDKADMVEIRLDLLNEIPNIPNKEMIITYRGNIDLSILPNGYNGLIDIGEQKSPDTSLRTISSFHDCEGTPDHSEIISKLNGMDSHIAKGAYMVRSFTDLHNIYLASSSVKKKHLILGMGEFGTVTRIRQSILKNEFTFAYINEPTALGQLSLDQMSMLDDDCIITGVLGYPLSKSMSPQMHNTAMRRSDINGIYLKFEIDNLNHISDVVREYNIQGMNVTIPHKVNIIGHLDSIDEHAEAAGAVNTIVNNNGKLKGYNTDLDGIDIALRKAGFDPKGKRALLLGSGGAARACAHYLSTKKCDVTVTGRNPEKVRKFSKETGCEFKQKESVALMLYDLVVNCTPIGMYNDSEYPVNMCQLTDKHTVLDMVYGKKTPIIKKAEEVGSKVAYGEDMLAGQGSVSFGLWTGKYDQFDTMRSVLG